MNRLAIAAKAVKTATLALKAKGLLEEKTRLVQIAKSIHLKQYSLLESALSTALEKFFQSQIDSAVKRLTELSTSEKFTELIAKNCGTGDGGFQPGNDCARGGDGTSEGETPATQPVRAGGSQSHKLSFEGNKVNRGEKVDEIVRAWFKKDLSDDELSSLAGAPSGSEISAQVYYDSLDRPSKIGLTWTNKKYGVEAHRIINVSHDGSTYMTNAGIDLEQGQKGRGLGTEMFSQQVNTAAAMGIKEIVCVAEGPPKNGYYTWARLGYDGYLLPTITKKLPPELKGATVVSDLMKSKSGRDWWRANGDQTLMRFNLQKGSQSRRVLDEYTAQKFGSGNKTGGTAGTGRDGQRNFGRDLGQGRPGETSGRIESAKEILDFLQKNCGTGAGGFQPGNDCARGGDGGEEDTEGHAVGGTHAGTHTAVADRPARATNSRKWLGSLSNEQRAVFYGWSQNKFKDIRDYETNGTDGSWRGFSDNGDIKFSDAAKHLHDALATAPLEKSAIYRGLKYVDTATAEKLAKPGTEFSLRATSSYSRNKATAEKFTAALNNSRWVLFSLQKPKTAVDIGALTNEDEAAGLPGTRYRVVSSKEVSRKYASGNENGFEVEIEELK